MITNLEARKDSADLRTARRRLNEAIAREHVLALELRRRTANAGRCLSAGEKAELAGRRWQVAHWTAVVERTLDRQGHVIREVPGTSAERVVRIR